MYRHLIPHLALALDVISAALLYCCRRDLTINSLFYNVNTGTVEDYTGKGTSDLRLGLVRTPLPACETLLDDPLRVLRAVRFASRLGFTVHGDLIEAGRDPRVHEALTTKVGEEERRRRGGGGVESWISRECVEVCCCGRRRRGGG